jgi:hypothetical protein
MFNWLANLFKKKQQKTKLLTVPNEVENGRTDYRRVTIPEKKGSPLGMSKYSDSLMNEIEETHRKRHVKHIPPTHAESPSPPPSPIREAVLARRHQQEQKENARKKRVKDEEDVRRRTDDGDGHDMAMTGLAATHLDVAPAPRKTYVNQYADSMIPGGGDFGGAGAHGGWDDAPAPSPSADPSSGSDSSASLSSDSSSSSSNNGD